MIKTYGVHDHWTDINKKNDVDIMSVDGVITGIEVNGEDYSGVSWTEVFSGAVTSTGEAAPFQGTIPAELSGADTIKVIFNNTEYIVNKHSYEGAYYYGATPGETIRDIDFSIYPFLIAILENETRLYTQAPGPKDLTILELQSGGGSSDFSTAEITVINNDEGLQIYAPFVQEAGDDLDAELYATYTFDDYSTTTVVVALYKGRCECSSLIPIRSVSGGVIKASLTRFFVTGDGTITIS